MLRLGIPGFLGLPSDFDAIGAESCMDLFGNTDSRSSFTLTDLADGIFTELKRNPPLRPWGMIGYSLGGRILLHLIAQLSSHFLPVNPSYCAFLSTHVGLKRSACCARIQSDESWARAFLSDPWSELIQKWDLQGAFHPCKAWQASRREGLLNRKALSQTLRQASLAHQTYQADQLNCPIPILWLTGKHDTKYEAQATGLAYKYANPRISFQTVAHAHHRILWDNAAGVSQILETFEQSII